jgi:hypothetical protein
MKQASQRLGVDVVPVAPRSWDQGLAQRLGQTLGLKVRFVDTKGKAEGFVDETDPRSVYIDAKSSRPAVRVFMHEFTHTLRRTAPDLWEQMDRTVRTSAQDAVRNEAGTVVSPGRFGGKQAADAAMGRYRGRADERLLAELDASPDLVREETVAESAGSHIPSVRELARLANQDAGLFRRVYDKLRAFFEEKLGRYRRMDAGSGLTWTAAREMRNAAAEIETVLERLLVASQGRARNPVEVSPSRSSGSRTLQSPSERDLGAQLGSLYDRAVSRADRNEAWVSLGEVRSADAARLERDGGVEGAATMSHMIDEAAIRHVIKRHAQADVEASRGQLPLIKADIQSLHEVVHNPDTVAKGERTKAGKPTVVLTKRINGHYLVVEEVRAGRNRLAVLTVRKLRAPGRATDTPAGAPSSYAQDVSPGTRDRSIRSGDERVNKDPNAPGGNDARGSTLLSPADTGGTENKRTGKKVMGRPDLANPAVDGAARELIDAVDEVRASEGRPDVRPDREVFATAAKRMQGDQAAERQRILDKVERGEQLSDVDTLVAKAILNSEAVRAVSTGNPDDLARATQLAEAYRELGAEQARAFRQRFDPMMTPAERAREYLTNQIVTPPSDVRQRIDALTERIRELRDGGDLEGASRARRRKERIIEEDARRARKISEKLKKAGIDLAKLGDEALTDPATAAAVSREVKSAAAVGFDMVQEWWYNSILSGPLTHIANLTGNTTSLIFDRVARKGAETLIGKVPGFRSPDSPKFREYVASLSNLHRILAESARMAMRSFQTETQVFSESLAASRGELGNVKEGKGEVSQQKFAIPGKAGRFIRIPSRALTAEDQFFTTFITNLAAMEMGYRQARAEGLRGAEAYQRGRELVADRGGDLWRLAEEDVRKLTFQNDTEASQAIGSLKARFHRTLTFVIPFVKTPLNVFIAGLSITPYATPVRIVRAIAAMAKGEYDVAQFRRDVTKELFTLGVVMLAAAGTDDDEPWLTGSAPMKKGEQEIDYRLNRPPYSIRIGDTWYSYRRVEPLATTLSSIVDAIGAWRQAEGSPMIDRAATTAGSALGSISRQVMDKTFLTGLSDVAKVMGNQSGLGDEAIGWGIHFGTGFVPNIIRQPLSAADPFVRDTRPTTAADGSKVVSAIENARRRALPMGAINEEWAAPRRVDLWGREIKKGGRMAGRMISPVQPASETTPTAGGRSTRRSSSTPTRSTPTRSGSRSTPFPGSSPPASS